MKHFDRLFTASVLSLLHSTVRGASRTARATAARVQGAYAMGARATGSWALAACALVAASLPASAQGLPAGHGPDDGHNHGAEDSGAGLPVLAEQRGEPWSDEIIAAFSALPIQDGGRVKPMSTFASFTLLRLNGSRKLELGEDEALTPMEWLLDVLFFPEQAVEYPCFRIANSEVARAIGVSVTDKRKSDRYTFTELEPGIDKLFDLAHEYSQIESNQRNAVQSLMLLLAENVNSFSRLSRAMDSGRYVMPLPRDPELAALFKDHVGAGGVTVSEVLAVSSELDGLRVRGLQRQQDGADPQSYEPQLRELARLWSNAVQLSAGSEGLAVIPPLVAAASEPEWYTARDLVEAAVGGAPADAAHVAMLEDFETLMHLRADPAQFAARLGDLDGRVNAAAAVQEVSKKLQLERSYYGMRILPKSRLLFLFAFAAMCVMWLRPSSKLLYRTVFVTALLASLTLAAAITMRCVIRGRPPVSTLYETVLFVTGVGAFVALFIEGINRQRIALSAAVLLGVVGLFIANGYEVLDKRDTMPSLVAVLDTNFWLATHVTSITIGYSAGMLAALMASGYLLAKAFGWRRGDRQIYRSWSRMVYGVLCFGLLFALVGTILGGIWANDSWGRFWGWDPKENGALLIVLSQILILHGRMGGYLREHGICMAAALGGTVVAFSWWGVNLLGVGLHSYGFTSGIHSALWTYYILQWSIVGIGAVSWWLERRRSVQPA